MKIVTGALRHFDGQRYTLDEFVVAANHVHVLVTPAPEHELSEILHSWKSFSAHEILKVEAASRRLRNQPVVYLKQANKRRDAAATVDTNVWQKESFDHIVRSSASLEKFRAYIRSHQDDGASALSISEDLRRDAAATLVHEACVPFDLPALRDALAKAKQEAEQTIDTTTIDKVIVSGFDAAAKEKAESILKSFRDYIEQHQAEIAALQILYSRPYKQRLTEPMLKELEKKLRDNHAAWTEDNLWNAFAVTAPGKVKGKFQAGRFADLVSLVRFALEQQPVLAPFADTVNERFETWLRSKQSGSGVPPLSSDGKNQSRDGSATFTPEQLSWLRGIAGHIATSLSIEPEDFDAIPFNQKGGLGKAYQLFGDQLPKLLDELNEVLAA
ncbi:MAG: transposase [Pontiellaceae bacterium]|jgi:REP element-mobilizing transposase RayT|nr:transposase [Pontiellaceae bacterium]